MISSNLSDLAEMVEKNRNGKTVVLATVLPFRFVSL